MLIENTLYGTEDKVQIAIDRIRQFEPSEGYYVAFSGGKDSIVVKDLVMRSGVKYDIHYNLTTVDPPELVYYIRQYHSEVEVERPEKTMWQLISEKRIPPLRHIRYCCEILKEGGGVGRTTVTGVRWQESYKRSKRRMVEICNKHKEKIYLHPIIDWSEDEVWEYINQEQLPYCKLYDEGFKRIGCIMCPIAGGKRMKAEAEKFPKYAAAYIRAMDNVVKKRITDGFKKNITKTPWKSGQEMYDWWMDDTKHKKENPDQTVMFE